MKRGWGSGFHGKDKKARHKKDRQEAKTEENTLQLIQLTQKLREWRNPIMASEETPSAPISEPTSQPQLQTKKKSLSLFMAGAETLVGDTRFDKGLYRNPFILDQPQYAKVVSMASVADLEVLREVLESRCWFEFHEETETKGQGTTCHVIVGHPEIIGEFYADAFCHSGLDAFNGKVGKHLSRARAWENALFSLDSNLGNNFTNAVSDARRNRKKS